MSDNKLLDIHGLVKKFGDTTILSGLTLGVRRGEVVVVLGPSGCGKSTLLRTIAGLETKEGGSVLLDGVDLEEEAKVLLARVGLVGREHSRPSELSGGQKQRVAIVRALAMKPEVLLLDEVTASLDPEMVREVLDVVLELADAGLTMLIVTHEIAFARAVADRIIFLEGGRIVEEAPPEQFFTSPRTERAAKFLEGLHFRRRKSRPDNAG